MDVEIDNLAKEIVKQYKSSNRDRRLLIAIAGPPGSGKSTLAYPLTDRINTLLSRPPSHPAQVDRVTGLVVDEDGSPIEGVGLAVDAAEVGEGEVAICIGLDGWHYTRKELDGFDDPVKAHWLRGAPHTFNLSSYTTFLQSLQSPTNEPINFPTFSHEIKDPHPSPHPILPSHKIMIVEGVHTLLSLPGWEDCARIYDRKVWVETDREVCRQRLTRRNFEAGICGSIEETRARVDAVDMKNGDLIRENMVTPTDIVHSIDEPASVNSD